MTCWALIPLKPRAMAKRRLASTLTPSQRLRLVDEMMQHVVGTLSLAPGIDGVAITSPEPLGRGVTWLVDRHGELNAALGEAACWLARQGVDELVVMHADLPGVSVEDVEELIAAGRGNGLAFAPDHLGQGTNGLYTRLPLEIAFCFGPDSLARFVDHARQLGRHPALLQRPGLAYDIDGPGDLVRLAAAGTGVTARVQDLLAEYEDFRRAVHS